MQKKGFTLIEVVIVMGIIAILFALSTPSLFRLRDRNTLQTTAVKLTSLIRNQQLSAMNSTQAKGIYFDTSSFVEFTGTSYTALDPANTTTILDYPLQFSSIQLPYSQLVFATGSGEIVFFDALNKSIILEDSISGESRTIEFNSFGVPDVK